MWTAKEKIADEASKHVLFIEFSLLGASIAEA